LPAADRLPTGIRPGQAFAGNTTSEQAD